MHRKQNWPETVDSRQAGRPACLCNSCHGSKQLQVLVSCSGVSDHDLIFSKKAEVSGLYRKESWHDVQQDSQVMTCLLTCQ